MPEILTLPEAAGLLRVSQRTLQRLVQTGTIPYAMVGRGVRFRKAQLLAWVEGRDLSALDTAVGRA